MATQTQFTALGQALDNDVTAIIAKIDALQLQIADLQAQLASGSGQMSGTQEDQVLVTFQAIADRIHALLP